MTSGLVASPSDEAMADALGYSDFGLRGKQTVLHKPQANLTNQDGKKVPVRVYDQKLAHKLLGFLCLWCGVPLDSRFWLLL